MFLGMNGLLGSTPELHPGYATLNDALHAMKVATAFVNSPEDAPEAATHDWIRFPIRPLNGAPSPVVGAKSFIAYHSVPLDAVHATLRHRQLLRYAHCDVGAQQRKQETDEGMAMPYVVTPSIKYLTSVMSCRHECTVERMRCCFAYVCWHPKRRKQSNKPVLEYPLAALFELHAPYLSSDLRWRETATRASCERTFARAKSRKRRAGLATRCAVEAVRIPRFNLYSNTEVLLLRSTVLLYLLACYAYFALCTI